MSIINFSCFLYRFIVATFFVFSLFFSFVLSVCFFLVFCVCFTSYCTQTCPSYQAGKITNFAQGTRSAPTINTVLAISTQICKYVRSRSSLYTMVKISFYIDVDECRLEEATCHENATYSDVAGGEDSCNCTCNPGFTGDGCW